MLAMACVATYGSDCLMLNGRNIWNKFNRSFFNKISMISRETIAYELIMNDPCKQIILLFSIFISVFLFTVYCICRLLKMQLHQVLRVMMLKLEAL